MAETPHTNNISKKARPNTSERKSLADALRDSLADQGLLSELLTRGARVSFIADARYEENGATELRHREFPSGGPGLGIRMTGETLAEIARIGRDGWAEAARIFLSAFSTAYGTDLDVVRVFSLTLLPL